MKIASRIALVALLALPARAMAQDSQCHNIRFRGNFRLNGAMQHLAVADSSNFPDVKRRRSGDALRVLNEAVAAGSVDQFTLWYMIGRVYGIQNDLAGADTAYTRAAAAVVNDPTCLVEIARLRKNMWIPLQNSAVEMIQAQNYDSALALLRKAHVVFRDDPSGYLNMAAAFQAQNKEDSAAAMYRLASHAGTSADRADLRATASFNAGTMLQRAGNLPAAESAYREYIVMKPRDIEAKGRLATLLSQMNRGTEAAAIYDTLMANADSLDSFGLFSVGVALFNTALADSAPANAARRVATFRSSARAFDLGLAKNRSNRDALYNLTNTYLAANDTVKVLEAAQRLVAVDSLNRRSLTLLARAQQMNRKPNDVVTTLLRRDSLQVEVTFLRFAPGDSTVSLRGGVQNLRSREKAAFVLTIEFLNGQGEVAATERVEVPALGPTGNPGSVYDFSLSDVRARRVVAYRYRIT